MNLTQSEEIRLLGLTTASVRLALTTTPSTDAAAGTEVSGGLYARPSVNFGTPVAGSVSNTDPVLLTELPACNVMCWEIWSADGTQRRWFGYFGTMSATWNAGVFTANAHGRANGTPIVFVGTPPTGLTAGTIYYVRDATTNTFAVALSSGGAAVSVSGTGSAVFARVLAVPAGESVQINAGQLSLAMG